MVSLNNEIGTPGISSSKKLSNKSKNNTSIKSFKESKENTVKESENSEDEIQIIPLTSIQRKKEMSEDEEPLSIEGPPHILSNDVSDIYRVINSDIQYRKSKKPSGKDIIEEEKEAVPLITIETNNLEKNKKEYLKKIETKISKNKFQKDLKELDFEEDLNKDDDMQKMKEHVKKLQAIRVEKQNSGVNSKKEILNEKQKKINAKGKKMKKNNY